MQIENPNSKKQETPIVRKVKDPSDKPKIVIPPALVNPQNYISTEQAVEEEITEKQSKPFSNDAILSLEYSIPYEPLCKDKIKGIPKVLRYKPINGFYVSQLNELSAENIDEGINHILDSLCFESKTMGFSHWNFPVNEKIRAFLNLRLNSVGNVIEHLFGVCSSCGTHKLFTKIHITKFDERDLKEDYYEPYPLKVKTKDGSIQKFKARLIQSGDINKAKQLYQKDKGLISELFPDARPKDEKVVVQVLEYANSILEIDEYSPDFKTKVNLCKNNIHVMNALTGFNDYFDYGLDLELPEKCDNVDCPSNMKSEEEKTLNGSRFLFSIQPAIFYITYSEESSVRQYFDV